MAGRIESDTLTAMKPTIRALRPSDMDRYAALCEAREELDHGAAERRARLVEWMAFHNPCADGDPTYFVVELGDRLMGHLGRMPALLQIQGERVQASYIHDLFVHPELVKAGQGFFLAMRMYRLAEAASKSFCALIWTNDINIRLQKARKYHPMWAHRHVKLLRADGHIDRHVPAGAAAAAGKPLAAAALALVDSVLAVALDVRQRIVPVERFDERFDRFAARMLGRLSISPYKDQRYLNWKYIDRPGLDAVHYAAVDGTGEITGFVVISVPQSAHRESYLLELVADPEDEKTIVALVNRAIEHCREAGAYTLQCMGTDPRFVAVLKKFLFAPRPPLEPLFLARPERYRDPDELMHLDNWHFSFGDSEGAV
jgi:GNAT superfamily N-acetyltransferase